MSLMLPEAGPAVLPYTPLREDSEVRDAIRTALAALDKRKPLVDIRWRYYDGDHDSLWLTSKLREVFGQTFRHNLEDNYCELAVEAVVLRLGVTGWQLRRQPDDAAPEPGQAAPAVEATDDVARVTTLWDANRLDLEQEELYRAARTAGEAYLMAWPRYVEDSDVQAVADDGTELYDITLQDARNVYLHVGTTPRERVYAVKVWQDSKAKRWRATVYWPDEVVRMQTVAGSTGAKPPQADRFLLDEEDPGGTNPLAVVPFWRFALNKRGRSILDSLRSPQDKINKLAVGKIVASEFAALRQRYALLGEDVPDHVLKATPGSVWKLPAGGPTEDDPSNPRTQVGEFSAADLSQFDNAKQAEVDTLLTLGMLPRNLRTGAAGASGASGEAITKDSGPFVSVVEDHQAMYGGAWRDLWEALGYDVVAAWAPAAFSNAVAVAEEVSKYVAAGVPLELALRWTGRTEDDLRDVRRLLDEQAARQANAATLALTAVDAGGSALDLLRNGMGAPSAVPGLEQP